MEKVFRVFQTSPIPRQVLDVSLDEDRLIIKGHPHQRVSLMKEGVDHLASGKHFDLRQPLRGKEAEEAFKALRAQFERDSTYFVQENEDSQEKD